MLLLLPCPQTHTHTREGAGEGERRGGEAHRRKTVQNITRLSEQHRDSTPTPLADASGHPARLIQKLPTKVI